MPNIFGIYNEEVDKEKRNTSPSEAPVQEQALSTFGEEQAEDKGLSIEGSFSGDPNQQEKNVNTAYSNATMGEASTINTKDRRDDPTTWSPEYTDRGFMEEAGNSVLRGVGNHLIKGTGDMLQVAWGMTGGNIRGNALSEVLQDSGAEMANKFKSYMPEELQHENLTWSSAMNPKFWSTHVAEMIPQLAEFIFLSKGGSALAKKGLKLGAKKLPGQVGKTALGKAIPGTAKGVAGKLATETGLTALGETAAGAVGGGIAGNAFSGLLNAAEVVNSNKDLVDASGNKVFSDEELQQLAAGTMKHNAAWVGMDMVSWGMTFGGGYKALKRLNPVSKGGKIWNSAQQSKIASKMFAYDMNPIIKGLGRVAGKAGAEGFEEMYQESWEEWAKKKAMSDVTGEPMPYNGDFFEFFNSKENEATKVLSAAVGALGGGVFNISSLINKKADDTYKMYDRAKNISEITNKQGTEKELEWQQYHIQDTIADIVVDGKEDAYEDFINHLVENGNINEDEKKAYDQMLVDFKETKAKAKRLNIKGEKALLHNKAVENSAIANLERYEQLSKQSVQDIQESDLTEDQKAEKIIEIEKDFQAKMESQALMIAEAKQNQSNLIIGKKASPLTMEVETNKYGKDMAVGGLSTQQFQEYTKEGEQEKPSKLSYNNLKDTGKGIYDNIVGMYNKATDSKLGKKVKEGFNKGKEAVDDKLGKKTNHTVQENEDGTFNVVSPEGEIVGESFAKQDEAMIEASKLNSQTDEEAEAENSKDDTSEKADEQNEQKEIEPDGAIDDETWNTYQVEGTVTPELLNEIAKKINNEEKLSPREEQIRQQAETEISKRIGKKILGTTSKESTEPISIKIKEKQNVDDDTLTDKEKEFVKAEAIRDGNGNIQAEFDKNWKGTFDIADLDFDNNYYVIHQTHAGEIPSIMNGFRLQGGGLNTTTIWATPGSIKSTIEAIQNRTSHRHADSFVIMKFPKADYGNNIRSIDQLSDQHLEWMLEGKIKNTDVPGSQITYSTLENRDSIIDKYKDKSKSIEDVQKKKNEEASKNFEIDQNKIDNAEIEGMDKRSKSSSSIRDVNLALAKVKRSLLNKIRNRSILPKSDYISQNELDNYLNTFTTYNLQGPDNIHKMAVVNHQLKRMFPNTNDPTQVIVVRNLYESVGSIGLGMSLAGTIYIDEKAWDQDNVFMHEMSHIYYQLTKDNPETQKLVKASLANKELVKEIKSKYDDYTLYEVVSPEGNFKAKKSQITGYLKSIGYDLNNLDEALAKGVSDGIFKTIPLSQQDLLIEEMFAAQLEGPLSKNFDKVFNTKNEIKREADTKKWWGLIRKKGKIIEKNEGVQNFLNQLMDGDTGSGDTKNFILDTFKAVTKGVTFSAYGLDSRVDKNNQEYISSINEIKSRKKQHIKNAKEIQISKKELEQFQDEYDDSLEDDGDVSFNADFDTNIKSATRILRRFGNVYNKALRKKFLERTKDDVVKRNPKSIATFNKDLFESTLFNLAQENNNSNDFIYNIENSALKEVKAFNRYLDLMHPEVKLSLLNSMHFVLSNSKHIVGFRNTVDNDGVHDFVNSLSTNEIKTADKTVDDLLDNFKNKDTNPKWNALHDAVKNIYLDKVPQSKDIVTVLRSIAPKNLVLDKVLESGVITYKGVNIPIEALIVRYIKNGFLLNKNNQGQVTGYLYYGNLRPLVEALINTNRKFTPLSSVMNAEGNMEPVRIINNHLTKEIDNMIDYMKPNEKGEKVTKEQFLDRFAHVSRVGIKKKGNTWYNEDGTKYVPNQFLENIYDQYQAGVMPTVSQYHGIQDKNNKNGSLFKNSTSLEQGIEDLLSFVRTSTKPSGKKNKTYLANLGAFSDSPRKFFMNMKRVAYDEVFVTKNGKVSFNMDGKIINSIFNMNKKLYPGNPNAKKGSPEYEQYQIANDKSKFRKEFTKAIKETISFVNNNSEQLKGLKIKTEFSNNTNVDMAKYFHSNGKLNKIGQELIAEYTINTIVNGYNGTEVFAPGIKGDNVVKRFKLNSSPVMSVKNSNFKIEPIFFADEILNNSISGTDSAMYILEDDAKMFQDLGKGVFEMNNGFKFLNASIEKDNPNFKGKTAYLKGYTTIVGKTHPLYKIMRARKDKYLEHYAKEHGGTPSTDLSDGTHNHIVIAVPQSSDKSNFSHSKDSDIIKKEFIDEVESIDENGNKFIELKHSPDGEMFTEQALSENIDEAMKYYDQLYYDSKGKFVGVDAYNFGPQQLMDKESETVNTPVQMVNNIIVNATLNGKLKEAYEIQDLIVAQKRANLDAVLAELKSTDDKQQNLATAYKAMIDKGLNKEDMDQAQRIMFEDEYSSIANPYLVEIMTNQLAKTLRKAGNKLRTKGTLAHQKPDSGWKTQAKGNDTLKGYTENNDGSLGTAEMVAPKHMEDTVRARESYTVQNGKGKIAIQGAKSGMAKKHQGKLTGLNYKLMLLENAVVGLAAKKFNVSRSEAQKYIGKEMDSKGVHIGYYVKGDTVIATRVPSDGPSSTGIFEVIGFDKGEGNQVMVSSEFNDIVGSDNDGDALFIQRKSNKNEKGFENWDKAFDKIVDYWLSPDMAEQITTKMVFEDDTKEIVKNINKVFPQNKEFIMPFSPKAKMVDYNNTMVSKRNVGPVFNIHKMTNLLGSVDVSITKNIVIGGQEYGMFTDNARGDKSRNQQSAILANIILDNAKHGFADALGLNEHNISQAVLMVNLGIPLEKVGLVLNSPAAQLWSELNRNNNSMFHESKSKPTITNEVYAILAEANGLHKSAKKGKLTDYIEKAKLNTKKQGYKAAKRPNKGSTDIDINNITEFGTQNNVLETLDYLADMNSEIQKLSKIMSGHKTIHVNPLVLEQQINDFKEVLKGVDEQKTLNLNDNFKANPDMKHYLEVAEEVLTHLQRINPVYQNSTNKVLYDISSKMDRELTTKQIDQISKEILKFNTSRLLGLNNKPIDYVEKLMSTNVKEPESIFNKLDTYISGLVEQETFKHKDDVTKGTSMLENSLLFSQALSYRINKTNDKNQKSYISANAEFMNASFNKIERERAQAEFEALPNELRDDLILYDLITRGWKGPLSLSPFFGEDTTMMINFASTNHMSNKNNDSSVISPKITKRLEHVIALRRSKERDNSFTKVNLPKEVSALNESAVKNVIMRDDKILERFKKGQPMYINVLNRFKKQRELYEVESFTKEERAQVNSERTQELKKLRAVEIAKSKMKHIPYDLHENSEIDLSIIKDKNTRTPFNVFNSSKELESLGYMKTAGISYDEAMQSLQANLKKGSINQMDAREDFYDETFARETELSKVEYLQAMDFEPHVSVNIKNEMYEKYRTEKAKANETAKTALKDLDTKTSEQLLNMYNKYGKEDVYAYAIIVTPVIKKLAQNLISEQGELLNKQGLKGRKPGDDISLIKSYLISGSTIPSNHPASQGLARMMEKEYKVFINEKKKYMSEMQKITDALYKERLGYGGVSGLSIQGVKNLALRIKDAVFSNREKVYDRLYGNLVIREESVNDKGTLVMNYKLRPVNEIEQDYKNGNISKAEKDFYDYFRKTTKELMPKNMKGKYKKDYIPHTSMNKLETFSSRGLLGLLASSRGEDHALQDVKLVFNGELMNFKTIQDYFKRISATEKKNNPKEALEFRKLKQKAKKLLKSGKNEDGSDILSSAPFVETALGFGAINRFANNRSVKATELPSMDLNKALGDYIHSSLFVNGNENFKGMEKLQGYIDGVLAWNSENNLPKMNNHIQTVWKDYFLRNKRKTSALGATTDRVILGLTRLNLFYALGYNANLNTGGLYAVGNVLAGKYHNIKDIGAGSWLKGESRFWGVDKGLKGGINGVLQRRKRAARIMKELNFMEINVYDEVSMENKGGLDKIFSDLALAPMIQSEKWIQNVHMFGLLTDEQLDRFDEDGNYKPGAQRLDNYDLIRLEDQVKSSHGRGYQPTDQRAIQMYSWGNMMLQFSRFIPTMIHDRFAKEDVNIYGRETIGSMTAVGKMLKYVLNNPTDFVKYRNSLSDEQKRRLDSGLKGVAMSGVISMLTSTSETANALFWDVNYYWNYPKLTSKMVPAPIQSVDNLTNQLF